MEHNSSRYKLGTTTINELQKLEKSFEAGDLAFETLERLNDVEASYLFRKKVMHAPLPAIPNSSTRNS